MTTAIVPALLFFDPSAGEEKKQSVKIKTGSKPEKEKRLFCAACRHPVTHQDQRIPVQGTHEHRCTNPRGVTYHFGCFREATGCTATGEATTEYTWFPGYAWRIALCANCHVHLGWQFQTEADYFYGLIINRLTSAGRARD